MNKGIFKRLTFLATTAFMAVIGVLCLGIGYYWFNFIVPSIQSGERVRAEMVMAQLTEKLEPVLEKKDRAALEDLMVRLLLMKDPSTDENLILGISVETLDGTRLTQYSQEPVKISGPFALDAPLYSSATQEVLGEVSFQYNPYFNELLVEDARIKLLWFLGLMAGVIFLLQRFLLHLLRPLSRLNASLEKIDFLSTPELPNLKGSSGGSASPVSAGSRPRSRAAPASGKPPTPTYLLSRATRTTAPSTASRPTRARLWAWNRSWTSCCHR